MSGFESLLRHGCRCSTSCYWLQRSWQPCPNLESRTEPVGDRQAEHQGQETPDRHTATWSLAAAAPGPRFGELRVRRADLELTCLCVYGQLLPVADSAAASVPVHEPEAAPLAGEALLLRGRASLSASLAGHSGRSSQRPLRLQAELHRPNHACFRATLSHDSGHCLSQRPACYIPITDFGRRGAVMGSA